MKKLCLSALLFASTSLAASNPGEVGNLRKFAELCEVDFQWNGDYASAQLPGDTPDKVVESLKNKIFAYRIPVSKWIAPDGKYSDPACKKPELTITPQVVVVSSSSSNYYAANISLIFKAYDEGVGYSAITVWQRSSTYLSSSSKSDFFRDLLNLYAKYMDEFSADWVQSHPLR